MFAAFSILEAFLSVLLHWIPFYFALKLAFLAWCFLPQTQVRFGSLEKERRALFVERTNTTLCPACTRAVSFPRPALDGVCNLLLVLVIPCSTETFCPMLSLSGVRLEAARLPVCQASAEFRS